MDTPDTRSPLGEAAHAQLHERLVEDAISHQLSTQHADELLLARELQLETQHSARSLHLHGCRELTGSGETWRGSLAAWMIAHPNTTVSFHCESRGGCLPNAAAALQGGQLLHDLQRAVRKLSELLACLETVESGRALDVWEVTYRLEEAYEGVLGEAQHLLARALLERLATTPLEALVSTIRESGEWWVEVDQATARTERPGVCALMYSSTAWGNLAGMWTGQVLIGGHEQILVLPVEAAAALSEVLEEVSLTAHPWVESETPSREMHQLITEQHAALRAAQPDREWECDPEEARQMLVEAVEAAQHALSVWG